MDPITQQQALAAAGAAGGEGLYVDEVFSTYLYEGTGTTQTITNGIDLAGEGGMVWIKNRSGGGSFTNNTIVDSERIGSSGHKNLYTNLTNAEFDPSSSSDAAVTLFQSNGFTTGSNANVANNNGNYASWTFRKAPGFFDVVTWTGDGVNGRQISHSLGSTPGMIMIKRTSAGAENWVVYHRSIGTSGQLTLNSTAATGSISYVTAVSSSTFSVSNQFQTNGSPETYVAYLFAHDDQSFGTDSNESIIKCGSYTGTGTAGNFVDLGFEPQFLIVKKSSNSGTWFVCDSMRGMFDSTNGNNFLRINTSDAEQNTTAFVAQPTGFRIDSTGPESNNSGGTFIYMAIRRPHKPPSAATEVFTPQATRGATDGTPSELGFTAGFPVDLLIAPFRIGGTGSHAVLDRMRGGKNTYLATASTDAESNTNHRFDSNEGVFLDSTLAATSNYGGLMFKRAPGFFDIVAYEGTGSARTISHNLTVAPELIIAKCRNTASTTWLTYASSLGATKYLELNDNGAEATASTVWNDTEPTSSVFSVGTSSGINGSGRTYISYLFASLDGISKVGSYTGNGTAQTIDCGFTNGARFILIKQTDGINSWRVFDSARGYGVGNDRVLSLDTTAGEDPNKDWLEADSSGFRLNTADDNVNGLNKSYIFLAIA